MLTTTVTTATAFGMTAIIKIPTVRYFAVFCSLMVAISNLTRTWTLTLTLILTLAQALALALTLTQP